MKNYDEMAKSVFERRDKYNAERKMSMHKRNKRIAGIFFCLVTFLGIGIWKGGTRTNAWMSADDVLNITENNSKMGVAVPIFVAYQGAIYSGGKDAEDGMQYALSGNEVFLGQNYTYSAYQIKNNADSVAIVINGRLTIFQKLFEVDLNINDMEYNIIHRMGSGYSCGEIVRENEDFTIYQAIKTDSGEVMQTEYLINLLPLFKREFPDLFSENENYGDVWWLAVPKSNS